MPDESCRTCGGELMTHSLCSECRKVTQKKCTLCQNITRKQFHDECVKKETLTISRGSQVLQAIHKNEGSGNHNGKHHSYALVIGIVGFFILGIATASYFDIFQSVASDVKVDSGNISSEQMMHSPMISQKSFQNCLA